MAQIPKPNRGMAISSKGSRKIVVDGTEFRWRAAGTDYGIAVYVWPKANEQSLVHGYFDYQQERLLTADGRYRLRKQLVVTNRLIRRIIHHYGVAALLRRDSRIQAGPFDSFIDTEDSVRAAK